MLLYRSDYILKRSVFAPFLFAREDDLITNRSISCSVYHIIVSLHCVLILFTYYDKILLVGALSNENYMIRTLQLRIHLGSEAQNLARWVVMMVVRTQVVCEKGLAK